MAFGIPALDQERRNVENIGGSLCGGHNLTLSLIGIGLTNLVKMVGTIVRRPCRLRCWQICKRQVKREAKVILPILMSDHVEL